MLRSPRSFKFFQAEFTVMIDVEITDALFYIFYGDLLLG